MKREIPSLARCAPIDGGPPMDRRMRTAVARAKRQPAWMAQQAFDRAVARLVKATPVPPEIAQWFANEKLAQGSRRSWKSTASHPAILAIAIALAVIAFVAWLKLDEQMHAFPGAATGAKLLSNAATNRAGEFEPVQADAGTMGDFFLMKHRLEHYDVPSELARARTTGVRVFDDEEAGRVAQIALTEKRMQFFIFPASADSRSGKPEETDRWHYLEQDGWSGALHVHNGICFMVVLRGGRKELNSYLRGNLNAHQP